MEAGGVQAPPVRRVSVRTSADRAARAARPVHWEAVGPACRRGAVQVLGSAPAGVHEEAARVRSSQPSSRSSVRERQGLATPTGPVPLGRRHGRRCVPLIPFTFPQPRGPCPAGQSQFSAHLLKERQWEL